MYESADNQTVLPDLSERKTPRMDGAVHEPTFTRPDASVPDLLTGESSGKALAKQEIFAPDPLIGRLLQFDRPEDLTIISATADPLAVSPEYPDLNYHERPEDLAMPGPLLVDPALPDLQQPDLQAEAQMPARPGELASNALEEMQNDETYQTLPTDDYRELYMQQQGNNSHRSRHMGMLELGLEREERRA